MNKKLIVFVVLIFSLLGCSNSEKIKNDNKANVKPKLESIKVNDSNRPNTPRQFLLHGDTQEYLITIAKQELIHRDLEDDLSSDRSDWSFDAYKQRGVRDKIIMITESSKNGSIEMEYQLVGSEAEDYEWQPPEECVYEITYMSINDEIILDENE